MVDRSASSTSEVPDVHRCRSGSSGGLPSKAGHLDLKEHQLHNLLGEGENEPSSAERSIAERIARILFSVAARSERSG